MHKFNPFRSKPHSESSLRNKTRGRSNTVGNISETIFESPINISAPIISDPNPNEEQATNLEYEHITEEQMSTSEETEVMPARYEHRDDQPASSISPTSHQSSLSTKKAESTTIIPSSNMVGNNPKEEVLTSCKATAMIYNDAQKKWIHCAPNGPAKIQLLFAPDTQTYRIVGRQIQDHEVVLNHSISKGLKYNQATATFHQWRDQSCVYGLNFSSKLDAQEFGTTMLKILESVNGSTNLSSQTNANGGVTLPSSTANNNNKNNNNESATSYKRQTNQLSTASSSSSPSVPPTGATTVSINSTLISSSSSASEIPPQQQQQPNQQQHISSSYNNQSRLNSNSINSTLSAANNSYYSQRHQPTEDDETNYALISDSYSTFADNSTNKTTNIPQAPPLNSIMSSAGSAPPAAPPPPPPPPPPPLPNGFGSGPPPAPALNLPTSNGTGANANGGRKSTTSSAPPMDLMSEMAAKFAQRRKNIDENDKNDSANAANSSKSISKPTTTTLPAAPAAPVQTSPRVARKAGESQPTSTLSSNDLEKLKSEILTELRKDIEKAKQEILTAIRESQKSAKK